MRAKQIIIILFIALAAGSAAFFTAQRKTPPVHPVVPYVPATSTAESEASSSPPAATMPTTTATQEATPQPIPPAVPAQPQAPAPAASRTSLPQPAVTVQIVDPDGASSFAVGLTQGADACGVLQEAKAEGKLRSLTIDDSYKASFGSSYVREINGYSNNWTFMVGSTSHQGCSLYKPQAGDTIVWTFGS